jgi:hypothetical protein
MQSKSLQWAKLDKLLKIYEKSEKSKLTKEAERVSKRLLNKLKKVKLLPPFENVKILAIQTLL